MNTILLYINNIYANLLIMSSPVSINDVINFIKKNISSINSIGSIDLNTINQVNIDEDIKPLKYYEIKKINYMSDNFKKIFSYDNTKWLRAGSLEDYSFFNSILICLIPNLLNELIDVQRKIIENFIIESKRKVLSIWKSHEYKKFVKQSINTSYIQTKITNNIITPEVINYISDYLHINIFVFDLTTDEIYFYGMNFIAFKKSILLLKFDNDIYELIFNEQSKFFTYNDEIINKIINSDIIITYFNDEFNVCNNENLKKYGVKINNNKINKEEIYNKTDSYEYNDNEYSNEHNKTHEERLEQTDLLNQYDDCTENMVNIINKKTKYNKIKDLSEEEINEISSNYDSDTESECSDCSDNSEESIESVDKKKRYVRINKSSSKSFSKSFSNSSSKSSDITVDKSNKINENNYDVKMTMKLSELQKIATKLKIDINKNNNKKKTKQEIINEIKAKIAKKK